jgi:CubicO group peptidase (beta-lactamase class C family)
MALLAHGEPAIAVARLGEVFRSVFGAVRHGRQMAWSPRSSVSRRAAVGMVVIVLLASCSGGGDDDAAAGGPRGTADGAPIAEEVSEHPVERWLASLVPWGFRGAVALVDGDETVVASGFGPVDPEGGSEAVGVDTRFAIGSITKDFVDIAVLVLEHRGQLQTDDTLGELLADVPADKARSCACCPRKGSCS